MTEIQHNPDQDVVVRGAAKRNVSGSREFRLRGEAMTRLEVFSDAAFAFALTMIVVSVGSIPSNYDELVLAMKNVPAFSLSFIQIALFWIAHRSWSRKYGLEDTVSTVLTLGMIFTILIYVYPLRLIFSSFFQFVTGGWLPSEFEVTSTAQIANLFIYYGVGYSTLTGIIALLHFHALRKKIELELTANETLAAKKSVSVWGTHCCFGFLSILFSLSTPSDIGVYSGFVYFLLGAAIPVVSIYYDRKIRDQDELDH